MKKHYLILFVFFLSVSKTLSYAQPIISSFSPSYGPVGAAVTLTGTNFNAITANNIVFFGATQAVVNTASTTSLNVTVPLGASFQPISVLDITTGLTDYSERPFNVTFACGGGISSNSFAAPIDSVTGVSPRTVCAADLDGDGKVDLVLGNQGSSTISVFRNTSVTGAISFAPRVDFNPGGIDPFSIEIGDLDGDGKPDIVLVNYNSNIISVFRNISTSGTISLATKIDFVTTYYPMSVSIGDLDGDGKADLAIGCWYLSSVPILRNTSTVGTISFAPKVEIAAGSLPHSIVIGELDGDNKPDLAVLNGGSGNISIFRNTSVSGTISFATRINYGVISPRSVTMGDLDGDGKSEIAVTCSYGSISVLRNTSTIGSVSFSASINFGTGTNPYITCIADMDGDGKPDFVVGSVDDNTVSVLRNLSTTGTLSFAAKIDFVTGGGPYSSSLADIDGDGRPDITTANNFSNNISVFRNQIHISPLMTSANAATICSGDVLNIPLTSDLSATFTWIATNCTNTIGESLTTQGTNTLSDVITNNTTVAQAVTYTVIPTSSTGCGAGTPQTVVITVNPAPTMNSAIAETKCSGESVSIALTSDIPASYTWLANDNLYTTGESITVQTTTTLSNIISNNTTAAETVSYAVTPISTSGSCAGTPQTVNVIVNPLPISNAGNDVTICSGIIDSIGSVAVLGNTYSWNSASGLSDSTVSKPGNTTINSGSIPIVTTYTLTTTITSTGCQSTDNAVITVNPQPVLTITNPGAECFPNTVDLTAGAVTSGSSGGGTFTYWTNVGATIPLSSANAVGISGTGYIKVTAAGGCIDIKPIEVTVNLLPIVSFSGLDSINCYTTLTQILTGSPVGGAFSGNGISGSFFSPSVAGSGLQTVTYTYTDGNNCINTSIQNTEVLPLPVAPSICMVTADSTSTNNIIYWDKTSYSNVDSFIVYRETVSNTYQKVGAVSMDSMSMFTDTVRQLYFPFTGDPNAGTYRYKLQIRDTCGNYGPLSLYHNTLYVTQTGGAFNWNDYQIEGAAIPIPELTAYYLYRDNNSNGNWTLVSGVSGSQLTINDANYSTYPNARWRIETAWSISCEPTRTTVNTARSNIKGQIVNGISAMTESAAVVSIYPNPFSVQTTIAYVLDKKSDVNIELYNALGQKMETLIDTDQIAGEYQYIFNAKEKSYYAGVYLVKVKVNGNTTIKRIVVME